MQEQQTRNASFSEKFKKPEKRMETNLNKFKKSLLYILRGQDQGKAAWYYVLLKDRVHLELLNRRCQVDKGPLPIEQYGKIIECGWGEDPPEDVKKRIEAEFGIESD